MNKCTQSVQQFNIQNLMFSKLLVPRILMTRVWSSGMFFGAVCLSGLMLIGQEVFMGGYTSKYASKEVFSIIAIWSCDN